MTMLEATREALEARVIPAREEAAAAAACASPLTPALVAMLPETMAELMREFLKRKDLTSRVQLKFRMKALLDYASVDTEYPPNPLIQDVVPRDARRAVLAMQGDAQSPGQTPGPAPASAIGTADILT